MRTSEDVEDLGVSTSYGPKAAQEVSGANLRQSIARLIKTRRKELGLSRRQLAQRAGINHSVISRIEEGQNTPSIETLARVVAELDYRLRVSFEPPSDLD